MSFRAHLDSTKRWWDVVQDVDSTSIFVRIALHSEISEFCSWCGVCSAEIPSWVPVPWVMAWTLLHIHCAILTILHTFHRVSIRKASWHLFCQEHSRECAWWRSVCWYQLFDTYPYSQSQWLTSLMYRSRFSWNDHWAHVGAAQQSTCPSSTTAAVFGAIRHWTAFLVQYRWRLELCRSEMAWCT